MTQETSEQRDARWRREQEADAVTIHLGFAFQTEHAGVCYWRGNRDAFRVGYEAGKAACAEAIRARGETQPDGCGRCAQEGGNHGGFF